MEEKTPATPSEPLSLSSLQISLHGVVNNTLGVMARKRGMELIDLDGYVISADKRTLVHAKIIGKMRGLNDKLKNAELVVSLIDSKDESCFGVAIMLDGKVITEAHRECLERAKAELKKLLMEFVDVIVPRKKTLGRKETLAEGEAEPRRNQVTDLLQSKD